MQVLRSCNLKYATLIFKHKNIPSIPLHFFFFMVWLDVLRLLDFTLLTVDTHIMQLMLFDAVLHHIFSYVSFTLCRWLLWRDLCAIVDVLFHIYTLYVYYISVVDDEFLFCIYFFYIFLMCVKLL